MKKIPRTMIYALTVAILVVGVIVKACSPENDKNMEEPEKVEQMEVGEQSGKTQTLSGKKEAKYGFIHFYDAKNNSEDEAAYERFEFELDAYVKENNIKGITIAPEEKISAGDAGEVNEVDIVTEEGEIIDSFSFGLVDKEKGRHVCLYSKADDTYTFAKNMEIPEGNDGVSAEEYDPYDVIKVALSEEVESTIKNLKISKDKVVLECKQCVNDNGYLGEVTALTLTMVETSEEGSDAGTIYLTGEFENDEHTPFFIAIKGTEISSGVGQ